ncbi:MAG: hypothetical protein IKI93_10345, partial [Clostridia bacterium]|nr:hypothetical protein [Clostridia bacterium]
IDLAPGGEMFDGFRIYHVQWCRIFRKYSNRFMFATDVSTSQPTEYMTNLSEKVLRFLQTEDEFAFSAANTAHGIGLEKEHLENILWQHRTKRVEKFT